MKRYFWLLECELFFGVYFAKKLAKESLLLKDATL